MSSLVHIYTYTHTNPTRLAWSLFYQKHQALGRSGFINYFGSQRFGSYGSPTSSIGRCRCMFVCRRAFLPPSPIVQNALDPTYVVFTYPPIKQIPNCRRGDPKAGLGGGGGAGAAAARGGGPALPGRTYLFYTTASNFTVNQSINRIYIYISLNFIQIYMISQP